MTVAELGEVELIARLARRLPPAPAAVRTGIGDDGAVLEPTPGTVLLATCDVQLAGVHFVPGRIASRDLGRRAAAINLSDLAAMGGRARFLLVSLVLPPDTPVADLEDLYDGLAAEAARSGAAIVGGNVSRGPLLAVDVTALGEAAPDRVWTRAGARPGDRILVTGTPGASAAGLALLLAPDLAVEAADREACLAVHRTPVPRLPEAAAAVAHGGVTAALDVSDGLASDLGRICAASGVGARLRADRLPLSPAAVRVAAAAGQDPLAWALSGGEDYELLLTAGPGRAASLARAVEDATGTPVTDIGEILPPAEGVALVAADGSEAPLPGGWRHF